VALAAVAEMIGLATIIGAFAAGLVLATSERREHIKDRVKPIADLLVRRRLDLELPATEIRRRLRKWKAPKPRYTKGVFHKYAVTVSNASSGAVTG
jgi:hypothetical protein